MQFVCYRTNVLLCYIHEHFHVFFVCHGALGKIRSWRHPKIIFFTREIDFSIRKYEIPFLVCQTSDMVGMGMGNNNVRDLIRLNPCIAKIRSKPSAFTAKHVACTGIYQHITVPYFQQKNVHCQIDFRYRCEMLLKSFSDFDRINTLRKFCLYRIHTKVSIADNNGFDFSDTHCI